MESKQIESKKIIADSPKKNLFFQLVYQIIILVIPLVLASYLTRVLKDTALGIYSFTYSIAYYFCVFAMMGISKYGQRVISENRDNDETLRKSFWSLLVLHLVWSVFVLCCYTIFCFFIASENRNIYIFQIIFVSSAIFDITWFFYGIEKFKIVVIKNLIIKIIELVLILVLIKNPSDLPLYTIIKSTSILLGFLVMIPTAVKMVKPIAFSFSDVKVHILPMIILFVSVLATTLYTMFDRTLLGLMVSTDSSGYYEYSDKIINIPRTIACVISTIMYPRACKCMSNEDYDGTRKFFDKSIQFVYFIGFGSIFGLLAIAQLFANVYFDASFAICGKLIMAMSPLVLIIGLSEAIRTHFLIPLHQDFKYTIGLVISAILNIVLSILLIPILHEYGAIIGSCFAEVFFLIYQIVLCRKYLDIPNMLFSLFPYIISGGIMFGVVLTLVNVLDERIISLIIEICVGGIIYVVLLSIYFLFISKRRYAIKDYLKKKFKLKAKE